MRTQRRQPVPVLPTVKGRLEEEDAVDQVEQATGTGGAVPEAERTSRPSSEDSEAIAWTVLLSVPEMRRQARYHAQTGRTRIHFDQPDGLWIIDTETDEAVRIPLTARRY